MILVIGGMAQGKTRFAIAHLPLWLPGMEDAAWADGIKDSWDVMEQAVLCRNLQESLRREGMDYWERTEELAQRLYDACPSRVILMNEVGSGIVPLSAHERRFREASGRLGCSLASRSSQVWRVCCGLGQRIR